MTSLRPNSPDREAAALSSAIGRRITTLRNARGWSLSTLASRANLGKATLSEVEAGRRNPTLETLYALAAELEVPLAELVVEPGAEPVPVATVEGSAVTATLVEVFADPGVTTEVYRLVIRPGARQLSPGHGPGVTEHLHVTRGTVLAGPVGRAGRASAGGHLSWDCSGEHEYSAVGAQRAHALLLIRSPRVGRS